MIKIPEDLLKINRDNVVKAIAMFDKAKEPSSLSFEDFQNFYQGKVFLQKLKMDIWLMQYQIWKMVWGSVLTDFNIKNHEPTYIIDPVDCCDFANDINDFSIFTVSYKVNAKLELNLSIVIYWKEKELNIYCSLNDKEYREYPIISQETDLVGVKKLPDYLSGSYNKSNYTVSLKEQDVITDVDIKSLTLSAREIVEYFNTHLNDIISK